MATTLIQPLPWRAESDGFDFWRVRDVRGFIVLGGVTQDEAEFIVRAVNSHAALVEALKAARMFIRNGIELGYIEMPDSGVPDPAHLTPGLIDAALALAEGR